MTSGAGRARGVSSCMRRGSCATTTTWIKSIASWHFGEAIHWYFGEVECLSEVLANY